MRRIWLIVQYAGERITHLGPAFSSEKEAERYAATLPEEWHAHPTEVYLDPGLDQHLKALGR